MAVTNDVPIYRYGTPDGHQPQSLPEKASASIYAGTIAVTQSGYAKDAGSSPASTDICWGLYDGTYDSQPHFTSPMAGGTTDGLHQVGVVQGTFLLASATGPDAIAAANIGSACYIYDNVTVALTNSTGSRAVAGTVMAVYGTSGSVGVTGSNAIYAGKVAVRLGATPPNTGNAAPGTSDV